MKFIIAYYQINLQSLEMSLKSHLSSKMQINQWYVSFEKLDPSLFLGWLQARHVKEIVCLHFHLYCTTYFLLTSYTPEQVRSHLKQNGLQNLQQSNVILIQTHKNPTILSSEQEMHWLKYISSPQHFALPLSFSVAQVYDDIRTGGVFEEGGLEPSHLFVTIHDAVLFATMNGNKVTHRPDLQEV